MPLRLRKETQTLLRSRLTAKCGLKAAYTQPCPAIHRPYRYLAKPPSMLLPERCRSDPWATENQINEEGQRLVDRRNRQHSPALRYHS